MTKEELKQYIDQNIYENVDGDISGDSLNEILKAIVDDGGTKVEANPTGEATTPLTKIKIGETNYNIPQTDTSNLATKQELQQGLSDKQDTIADLEQIRTRADEGHTALQPLSGAQENNFASFDSDGGLQDSGCNEGTFIKGVKQNGTLITPVNGVVDVTIQDGEDGLSAFEIAQQQGYTGTVDQWLASLKANIGEFLFVPTDVAAVSAMGTIGQTYSSAIDPNGKNVAPIQNTLSVILLMNAGTTPDKTMMIATQETATAGVYEFVYAGNLQDAMPGNVLTKDDIDNDFSGGSGKVAGADEVKTIAETTMELVESENLINPAPASEGGDIDTTHRINRGGELKTKGDNPEVYGCTDFIEIGDEGLKANHCVVTNGSSYCAACVYDVNHLYIGYVSVAHSGDARYVSKDSSLTGTPVEGADTENPYYVRFNFYNPASVEGGVPYDDITDGYAVYRGTTLPSVFQPWFEPYLKQKDAIIQDGAVTTSKIADAAVTIDKMADTEENPVTDNICNPEECYFGNDKYISRNYGTVSSFTDPTIGGYTGFIPIDSRGLAFTNILYSGKGIGGAVYDANKAYIRSAGSTGIVAYQNGDAYVRFTLGRGASAENVMVNVGNTTLPYMPFLGFKKVISPDVLPSTTDEVDIILTEKKIFTGDLSLLLPTRFYFVKGDTLQLFHNGIVKSIGLENRYVKPTCDIGTPYRRYIEFPSSLTPSVGDKSVSFTIYDDNENVLGSGSSKIKVVNSPTSPASEKHILCIGSSTTGGGQWVCEAQRRLLASDGTPQGNGLSNLVFVGKQTQTLYGQTAHLQGNSGWAWKDFATEGRGALTFRFYLSGTGNPVVQGNQYTNNGHTYTVTEVYTIEGVETIKCSTDASTSTPTSSGTLTPVSGASYPALTYTSVEQDSSNPFWNSTTNKLDFTSYVNTYCNGSVDIVYTVLGVNNMFNDGVDGQEVYVRTFIEALHTEYPNCVIVLATDALPSMVDMMPGYGASNNRFSNTYKVICEMHKVYQMYKKLELEYTTRAEDPIQVEFESWCAQVDSDYNFPLIQKNVNTRNSSVKEPYARNTIHPGDGTNPDDARGYMQMADAVYRSIVAHLCQ